MNSITLDPIILKKYVKKGTVNGLLAFVISYILVSIVSITFNMTAMNHLSKIIQGSIGKELEFSYANVLKVNNALLNFSVFNRVGELKFGLLILAVIPLIAFAISNRQNNKQHGLDFLNSVSMVTSSLVYAIILMILGFSARGELTGIEIDFVSVGNFFNTLIIVFLLQFVLSVFYVKDAHPAIKATRSTIRTVFLTAVVVSLITLISVIKNVGVSVLIKIAAVLALLPNFASYEMFMNMGLKLSISESLVKLLETGGYSLNYSPVIIRILFSIMVIGVIAYNVYRFTEEEYIVNTILYAELLAVCLAVFAHCSKANFGAISFIGDVSFGINTLYAFFVPLLYVFVIAIFIFILKKTLKIIKE